MWVRIPAGALNVLFYFPEKYLVFVIENVKTLVILVAQNVYLTGVDAVRQFGSDP